MFTFHRIWRLLLLINLVGFLSVSVIGCNTYNRKDGSGKGVSDYSAAIGKNPADHEAFYNRAGIHMLHCSNGEARDFAQPCLEDMDKAIQIAGQNNVKPEYYYRRGYCRSAIVLNECWWHTGRTDHQDWRGRFKSDQQEMLRQSIIDFDKGLLITKKPQQLALFYDRRAGVQYYLDEHNQVLADIAKLWQTVGSIPWEHEDAIFAAADPNHPPSMAETNYQVSKLEDLSCKKLSSPSGDKASAGTTSLRDYCENVRSRYLKNFGRFEAYRKSTNWGVEQDRRRAQIKKWEPPVPSANTSSNHMTCQECGGSGVGKYYEMGESAHCLADRLSGKIQQCVGNKEGAFVTRKCHVCNGSGRVPRE